MNNSRGVNEIESIGDLSKQVCSIDEAYSYVGKIVRKYLECDGLNIPKEGDPRWLSNCLSQNSNLRYRLNNVIERSLNNFFTNGLKDQERIAHSSQRPIIVSFCDPTNKSLKDVLELKLMRVIAVKIVTELNPRYSSQGDGGMYEFVFEIKVKKKEVAHSSYHFDASCIKKSAITKHRTEESMKQRVAAYRSSLGNIVGGFK